MNDSIKLFMQDNQRFQHSNSKIKLPDRDTAEQDTITGTLPFLFKQLSNIRALVRYRNRIDILLRDGLSEARTCIQIKDLLYRQSVITQVLRLYSTYRPMYEDRLSMRICPAEEE
ncbi:MAG: hypothetical protein Q9213_004441 [Squamulea squamosa]